VIELGSMEAIKEMVKLGPSGSASRLRGSRRKRLSRVNLPVCRSGNGSSNAIGATSTFADGASASPRKRLSASAARRPLESPSKQAPSRSHRRRRGLALLTFRETKAKSSGMKKILFPVVAVVALGILFSAAPTASAADDSFKVSEFTYQTPKGWTKGQPRGMRKAQLTAPGKDGKDGAEVTFFYFGEGGGGPVEDNVARWIGQFKDQKNSKEESKTVNGVKITYVSTEGTFMSGPPFGGAKTPMSNSGLLGAIVEGKQGNVFIKMTGPLATIKGVDAGFRGMVENPVK
jgi:hypothetical protein